MYMYMFDKFFFMSYLIRLIRKPTICKGKTKDGNREADQAFVFATRKVHTLFLNPKFPASRHPLCLYSSVCVGPSQSPHCWLSQEAAHYRMLDEYLHTGQSSSVFYISACVFCHLLLLYYVLRLTCPI